MSETPQNPGYNPNPESANVPPATPGYTQPGYDAPAPGYGTPPAPEAQYAQPQAPQAGYEQQGYTQPGYAQPYAAGYEQKSKIVAGLLGIFLGSLGIHRFYLGYTKIGVIQLILSIVTFGIAGLWGFIEGILILCGVDGFKTDVNGVPLKD
ncbi:TM2 domain-containing protein [Psychromicrobium xiongbiense]|uniref:TM2 domain-containing protein n=1 Tax=Psychromicrobium xiongbiense TaxID=3051184 RepID=UPI0025525B78|nr:TM2 domain-containing protein [Psychromicrobium sp. YIM S02556]